MQPRIKLHEIATRLDVTTQASSEYIKLMIKENLITKLSGEYKLTHEGVEFLHKNISELKDFLDSKIEDLDIINSCTAIAGENLKKGDNVNLMMEDGLLLARKNGRLKSGSTSCGVILYNANKGDDVAVVNLKGILDYDFGTLTIITLPTTAEGGTQLVSTTKLKGLLKNTNPDRIAIYDLMGQAILNKIDQKPDIEFFSLPASIEAVQKGFNVTLLTSDDTLSEIISQIENNNSQTKSKIHYSVITWKEIKKNK
jgi:putative transcriptional regulator